MPRRPLRTVLTVLAVFLLLIPLVLCIFGFLLPAQYTQTFLGELPHKTELLRTAQKPRIILVGGSSVPFSVKSELIQAAFEGYTVVDFGLYADIGTPVMLDLLEEELRPGDIVIISPEQNSQALSTYFSPESLWQAIDGSFDLLEQLSSHRYEKMAAAFPVFAGKKCYYALFGNPLPQDIYARSSFNAYGDIESPLRSANIMAGGFDPNQPISFAPEVISGDFVTLLNDFAAHCRQIGADVYYRFPPMNAAAVTSDTGSPDDYYDHLNSRLDFPIMGDPNRSIMASGWFYDTNFHLNDSGATVFTKYLIEDLKILFLDTSPTDIPLPAMPAPTPIRPVPGDDSCAHCFTYRKTDNGWIVVGLTAEGNAAEVLIVPTTYDGQPVVGIDQGVFQNNHRLKELVLQENIGLLYDGMFRGCTGLRRLVITGAPTTYTVGDGLMEGANFLICVPADQVDDFRRHYSWQRYSSYITPASE